MEIQKFDYLMNEKSFLDEIKSIFHSFWRAVIWSKTKVYLLAGKVYKIYDNKFQYFSILKGWSSSRIPQSAIMTSSTGLLPSTFVASIVWTTSYNKKITSKKNTMYGNCNELWLVLKKKMQLSDLLTLYGVLT